MMDYLQKDLTTLNVVEVRVLSLTVRILVLSLMVAEQFHQQGFHAMRQSHLVRTMI